MQQDYQDKPEIGEPPVRVSWTDPITGLEVPKRMYENVQWRRALLDAASQDPEFRNALYTACSKSFLFWLNSFCFTLRYFEIKEGKAAQVNDREIPFISWPIQDELSGRLEKCVQEGESILVEKSRDMGASWLAVAMFVHRFLFRRNQSFLMISRKESAVDELSGLPKNYPYGSAGSDMTLMGKVDAILSRLPPWMLPKEPLYRKSLHLYNSTNRSRIDGESSNATAGSGDRRTGILLDEFSKVDNGEEIRRSTKDVSACRIVVSSPNGPGTTFSKWATDGTIPVFTLPWFCHPEKAKGLSVFQNNRNRWEITSPWLDNERRERSPKELAIEVLISHEGSGDSFFENEIIQDHKLKYAKPPLQTLDIRFKQKLNDTQVERAISSCRLEDIEVNPDGDTLKIWQHLIEGRLDQTKAYTLGVDISKGQGASNSTIAVVENDSGEKVAEFADANIPPYDFAKISCAIAIWVGGRNRRPLVIFENNGDPGADYGRQIVTIYKYPNLYFDRRAGTVSELVGKRYGWRSSPEKKAQALGLLRRCYAHKKFVNHSAAALDETLTYIQFPNGSIGPAVLLAENESTRKAHGDRVVADMLALWGRSFQNVKFKREEVTNGNRTFMGRFESWKRDKNRAKGDGGPQYKWENELAKK